MPQYQNISLQKSGFIYSLYVKQDAGGYTLDTGNDLKEMVERVLGNGHVTPAIKTVVQAIHDHGEAHNWDFPMMEANPLDA